MNLLRDPGDTLETPVSHYCCDLRHKSSGSFVQKGLRVQGSGSISSVRDPEEHPDEPLDVQTWMDGPQKDRHMRWEPLVPGSIPAE